VVEVGVTYDYDAYGNLIHSTGSTPNNYLFAGEQFDPDLNLYYNRARYLNVSTGRFWTMDTYQGDAESPLSLHKYLYASSSPVDRVDPSGNFGLEEAMVAIAVSIVLLTMSSCSAPGPSSFVEVKQVAYQREENGLYIALGAYTKSRSPQFPEYNWVQYVTTNAIQPKFQAYEQPDVPFIDPPRPNGVPPFFYVGKEPRPSFGNYDLCFDDRPLRDPSNYPNVHGTIYWRAELFLVGVSPAGSSSYAKITRITYGFTVAQNGNMTWDDLNISKLVP
jgi:RHS repeat-associated protein